MSLVRASYCLDPIDRLHCTDEADCNDASQVWNEADAEEEVLAMVVRTGLRYVTFVNNNSSICLFMDGLTD